MSANWTKVHEKSLMDFCPINLKGKKASFARIHFVRNKQ